jgi:hypothetical protein
MKNLKEAWEYIDAIDDEENEFGIKTIKVPYLKLQL